MVGILALFATAIERTLNMFADNNLKVKQVLASGSQGKLAIKLPKVLNKTTGKMMNAPFLFSGVRWTKVTASSAAEVRFSPVLCQFFRTPNQTTGSGLAVWSNSGPNVTKCVREVRFAFEPGSTTKLGSVPSINPYPS
ncbi:hypothetical protein EDB19DRAFT_1904758 [Suillus lakei]|nr:hypothetical protein EDB19DRAFT_1904758 [Suillus lakei]